MPSHSGRKAVFLEWPLWPFTNWLPAQHPYMPVPSAPLTSSLLTPLQPHQSPCCSLDMPHVLSLQGLCTGGSHWKAVLQGVHVAHLSPPSHLVQVFPSLITLLKMDTPPFILPSSFPTPPAPHLHLTEYIVEILKKLSFLLSPLLECKF